MITETKTAKSRAALTSDRWHVVHARFVSDEGARPFARVIVSEHDDRVDAVKSARLLLADLRRTAQGTKQEQRDQVFVRKPGFVSLLVAPRGKAGRS